MYQLLSEKNNTILWIFGVLFLLVLSFAAATPEAVGWFVRIFVLPGWLFLIVRQSEYWPMILSKLNGGTHVREAADVSEPTVSAAGNHGSSDGSAKEDTPAS
jgi:hypothetical protein